MTEAADGGTETWGELGEAMRDLSERERVFVTSLVTGKPGYGALTRAYRASGFRCVKPSTQSKEAHKMSRKPKIIAAIAEEAKKIIRGVGYAEATAAILNMVRDPSHREHGRAVAAILDRVDPVISKQSIDVTHRHEDPDRMALEELKALRKLGTARDKLLELYGPNGLDRLEMLEAAETAQSAAAAKMIEHDAAEMVGGR